MNLNWTFVGQSVTFFVFVGFCYKFIWPVLVSAMRERQKTIAEGLENAIRAQQELDNAKSGAVEALQEARTEAQGIIEQARKQAAQMLENAKTEAESEGERIKEAGRADFETEVNQAREALRSQIAGLAVSGAEKIIGTAVDREQHAAMLDKLATEL